METPDVFVVAPVTFEEAKEDPFGFDEIVEKIGAHYVPFASTVRRIRYVVFIPFVEAVLKKLNIEKKKHFETKCRLEKLFVYLAVHKYKLGQGSGLLGVSFAKKSANPFDPTSSDWIKVNCYKLYSKSSLAAFGKGCQEFIEKMGFIKKSHLKFIREFLSREGLLKDHKKWLDKQRGFEKSVFDFSRPLPQKLYNYLKKQLRDRKEIKRLTAHYPELFNNPEKYKDKILNDPKDFPFKRLNELMSNVIKAINEEIENGERYLKLWGQAFKSNRMLLENYPDIQKEMEKCSRSKAWRKAGTLEDFIYGFKKAARDNVGQWFDVKNQHFKKGADFNSSQWETMCSRAKRQRYSDFRLNALASIIRDIISQEGIA